jgi:hypothetical protein
MMCAHVAPCPPASRRARSAAAPRARCSICGSSAPRCSPPPSSRSRRPYAIATAAVIALVAVSVALGLLSVV